MTMRWRPRRGGCWSGTRTLEYTSGYKAMSEDGKAVKEERKPRESQPKKAEQADATAKSEEMEAGKGPASTDTESVETAEPPTPGRPGGKGGIVALVVILFLVLLAALAGASWYGWQLIQADKASLARVAKQQTGVRDDLGNRLDALQQKLSSLSSSVSQQNQSLSDKVSSTDEQVSALTKQLAQITDRLSRGDLAWHVAEVGFLLTRAQERLTIAHDPKGARMALGLADQRLAALARPELMPVRSAISEVRAKIAKANGFDRIGMALHLRRAADSVSDWPLKGMETKASAGKPAAQATAGGAQEGTTSAEKQPWYQRAWDSTRNWFGRQFTITRSNEPAKVSARVATDRETRLWLTAVREALLARDVHGVGAAVDQARQWIRGHYAVKSEAVADTLKALQQTRHDYADHPWPSMAKVFKVWDAAGLDQPQRIAKDGLKTPAADSTGGAE